MREKGGQGWSGFGNASGGVLAGRQNRAMVPEEVQSGEKTWSWACGTTWRQFNAEGLLGTTTFGGLPVGAVALARSSIGLEGAPTHFTAPCASIPQALSPAGPHLSFLSFYPSSACDISRTMSMNRFPWVAPVPAQHAALSPRLSLHYPDFFGSALS
jgi:hypothetical protein